MSRDGLGVPVILRLLTASGVRVPPSKMKLMRSFQGPWGGYPVDAEHGTGLDVQVELLAELTAQGVPTGPVEGSAVTWTAWPRWRSSPASAVTAAVLPDKPGPSMVMNSPVTLRHRG
jgi:hypothetical protein